MPLASIEEALDDLRRGRIIILVDDEDRENEGDLVMAAEAVTPEAINFMAKFGKGLICAPLEGDRLDQLQIPMMVPDSENTAALGTAFTVSVEAKHGTTTGISAQDRATTIQALVDPATRPIDLSKPGHIFRCAPARRRPRPRRADRGQRRSLPARRLAARRRHLRNHEPGRHDGPAPRA